MIGRAIFTMELSKVERKTPKAITGNTSLFLFISFNFVTLTGC